MRLIVLNLTLAFALMAQSSSGDYSLAGTVVNSLTNEPVKNALVGLMEMPRATDGNAATVGLPKSRAILTGVDGEFQFAGLAKGQYFLVAQKPGWVPHRDAEAPVANQVTLSASLTGFRLTLAPLGVIAGRLANQYGEPVRDANVALLTSGIEDGVRTTSSTRTVVTNDRGEFRLWDLAPGTYYLEATGRAGGTSTYVGDSCPCLHPREGFRPVYFGGARSFDSAAPIVVAAGTEAWADFSVPVEPAFRVRGAIGNSGPDESATFELFEKDEGVAPRFVSLNAATGAFIIPDVVSGQYTLRVTEGFSARGEVVLNVSGGDVNGVSVPLVSSVAVTGLVRVIGALPAKSKEIGEDEAEQPEAPPSCNVSLHPVGRQSSFPWQNFGQMNEGGAFTIPRVFAGEYRVGIDCTGGYVASALSGSLDLLANPQITVQPGIAPSPIEISLNSGGGALHGKLEVSDAPRGGAVLLAPAFAASTGPVVAFLANYPDPKAPPEFEMSHLAPGEYLAYAFSDFRIVEFRKPGFLQALTGGTNVRIEDGKTTEITLASLVK
ncbi:MAG: collagen binding domain-containing protein [Bryobacteraceae bacterium]